MTKHKYDCKMAFGRKDKTCPRCQELLAGSAPRAGWQKYYYENKKRDEEKRSRWIKQHNCSLSNCGPVCTAFDW